MLGEEFRDFSILGCVENQKIIASTDLKSELLNVDFNGMMDISSKVPSFDVNVDVRDADLYEMKLLDYDKKSVLSTNVKANLTGLGLDKMYGAISLDNTTYTDSRGDYFMDSLDIQLTENYFDSKDVLITNDFFDMDLKGIINFATIGNSFKNYIMQHFHVDKWSDKGVKLEDNTQDFYVNMT